MSWNYDTSDARIRDHLENMGDIEVEPLVKLAELDSLLSETTCREIYAAHVYAEVPNFTELVSDADGDEAALKRIAQAVHVYEREVARIVEGTNVFDAVRVHFQGTKLHALLYRPVNDSEAIAADAVLLQLVLRDFVSSVFNPAFPRLADFGITGGADLGDVIGTRNGLRGDRELLFLGAPANYAAKILGDANSLTITSDLYEALPEDLADLCSLSDRVGPDGCALYDVMEIMPEDLDELCDSHNVGWNADASAKRVADDKAAVPLSEIRVESAEVKIDLDALSIRKNKLVMSATIFADVAGFTSYSDEAETDEDKEEALRTFHAIRREMSRVVRHDYDALHVQFQGDRLQGLVHMPAEDAPAIVTKAVEIAAALQSSMTLTLPQRVHDVGSLSLAIGIDIGPTFVSKLGTRGHRDRICIGEAVEQAAECEESHDGGVVALTARAYDVLPEEIQDLFTEDPRTGDWLAAGLTVDKVERAQSAKMYDRGPVHIAAGATGVSVSSSSRGGSRAVHPASSYGQ